LYALALTACGGGAHSSTAVPPDPLTYTMNPAFFLNGSTITPDTIASNSASSFSISPALPAGLSFDTSTGTISGLPTVNSAPVNYTITGTNSYGSNYVFLNLGVGIAPSITYPGGGILSFFEGTSVGTVSPTVTNGPVTSCTSAPALPAGLTLDSACGITGTPATAQGSTSYTITPGNGAGNTNTYPVAITITSVAPTLAYPSGGALSFIQGISVGTITPTVTNGPVTSCTIAPAIPAGLSLDSLCNITGTPTAAQGSTAYTVTSSNVHGSAPNAMTITVQNLPPAIGFTPNNETFTYHSAISTLTPTNTGGPISSCAIAPNLNTNTGLTFSTTNCQISGTPTSLSGATSYTVTPSGPGGTGAGTTITIGIADQIPVIVYSGSPYTFTDGASVGTVTPSETQGSAITSCAITPALSAGLVFSTVNCQITGTPVGVSALTTYTVTPTNTAGTGSGVAVKIQVVEQAPNITYPGSPFTFTQSTAIATVNVTNTGGGVIASCSSFPALPAGLALSSTCSIAGTPTASQAATTYAITATNSAGNSSQNISIKINGAAAPNLSFASSPWIININSALAGGTPTNAGAAVTSCTVAPALPAGLSISSTCVISGTPTVAQAATTYTVSATNAGGTNNVAVSIAVITAPVLAYPGSPYVFTKNVAISTITPTNAGSPTTNATPCAIVAALPAGLSLNTTTCAISGTPTALSGATAYTVTGYNQDGNGSAGINIAVNDAAPTLSYSPTTYTFNKNVAITSITPTLGGGAVTGCTSVPTLPAGLVIAPTTCQITGTPTAFSASQTYTVTATNTGGSASQNLTIAVNDAIPAISYANTPFTFTINTSIGATGATTPGGGAVTSCSISPTLPAGLSMNTACNITGTPTAGQSTTTYTVSATNTGGTQTVGISIAVNTKPVISYSPSSYTYTKGSAITALNPANAGFGGITSCTVAPNVATNTGLTFSAVNCQISGTPTTLSGATVYTVTPTDAVGAGTAATVTITVNDVAPSIGYSPSTYTETVNNAITTIVPSSTGGTPVTCTAVPTLPTGMVIAPTTCQITGTPTVTSSATSYTVTATNTGGSATANLTFTVKNSAQILFYSKQKVAGVTANSNNVWQVDVNGLNPKALTTNTAAALDSTYPSFLGTGGTAVFSSVMKIGGIATLSYNIWSMTASTSVPVNGGASQTNLTGNTAGAADVYDSGYDASPCGVGNCTPVFSPSGTQIAFASKQALSGAANGGALSAYNIFIMNADGSGVLPLTKNTTVVGADSVSPVWSIDGTKIFFSSKQGLATTPSSWNQAVNANSNIWSIDTGGVTLTALTTGNTAGTDSTEPTVSPDGVLLAFTSKMKITGSNASTNIWTMHTDGTLQTALTKNNTLAAADSKNPSFSPDASEIAYASLQKSTTTQASFNVAGPSSSFNIWKMRNDGSNLAELTSNTALNLDSVAPSWEPDSLYLAFQSKQKIGGVTPSSWNIWVMKEDGTAPLNLTGNTAAGLDSYLNPVNNIWYRP
jgi:hypothetical protein